MICDVRQERQISTLGKKRLTFRETQTFFGLSSITANFKGSKKGKGDCNAATNIRKNLLHKTGVNAGLQQVYVW